MSGGRRKSKGSQAPTAILTWPDVNKAMASVPQSAAPLLRKLLADHVDASPTTEDSEHDVTWFLSGVEISGHIGIGEYAVKLDLVPGPGLTVITAPNGTGKTSIVHGMRRCLGDDTRSDDVLPDNLHHKIRDISVFVMGGTRSAALRCSGVEPVEWIEDHGTRSLPPSWERAFQRYQPVLLYPEVARLITEPSTLHAFLESAISVDVLLEVQRRIEEKRSACREAVKALVRARGELDRTTADNAYTELRASLPPSEGTPSQAQRGRIDTILSDLRGDAHDSLPVLPELDDPETYRLELLHLVEQFLQHRAQVLADSDKLRDALLFLASDTSIVAQERDEDRCPVCESRHASWLARAKRRASVLDASLGEVDSARQALGQMLEAVTSGVPAAPKALDLLTSHTPYGEFAAPLKANWQQCRTVLARLKADTIHREQVESVLALVGQLRDRRNALALRLQRARSLQSARHDVACRAAGAWLQEVDRQEAAIADSQPAEQLKAWIDERIKATRNALFEPIANGAMRIWAKLNPSSDLGLAGLGIVGGTQRQQRVMPELDASGISVPNTAQGVLVLSTGQRNALSLATFLPRSAQDASPFRFLVLDDPIQAFDGARVHYLATELAAMAGRFQVVVFTHDERLWHEVSGLSVKARRVALRRRSKDPSHVEVMEVASAGAVLLQELDETLTIYDAGNPAQVAEEAIMALTLAVCRQALDAEMVQQLEILGRRCGKGESTITTDIESTGLTRKRLNLIAEYCAEAGVAPLDLCQYEATISALNQGSHAQVEPGSGRAEREQWRNDAVQLVERVAGLSSRGPR